MKPRRRVPVNELNQPLGEAHPRTKIPDLVVRQIRDMYEYHQLTSAEIARKTGVKQGTVRAYVQYTRRRQVYSRWREEG